MQPQSSGLSSAHRLALPRGYMLEGYRIERVLGKGGFGITYLAVDVNLNMPVAIKEMLPDGIATRVGGSQVVAQSVTQEDGFRWAKKRFVEEARTLARLQHPSVVRIQRLLEGNGTAYIVMEYVEGTGYDDWLKKRSQVSEAELMAVVQPLMDGLEYVHKQGLLHRDIKPENIFITKQGRVLLLDFGSARADLGRTTSMTSVVSEGYSPLEQYQTKSAQGPYTDVYALACVMARVITGRRPASAIDRLSNASLFPPLHGRRIPGWSPALLKAVDSALAIMPRDRVPHVGAFREMLKGVSGAAQASMRQSALTVPLSLRSDQSRRQSATTVQHQMHTHPMSLPRQVPSTPQGPSTLLKVVLIGCSSVAVGAAIFMLLGGADPDVLVANSSDDSPSSTTHSAPAGTTPQTLLPQTPAPGGTPASPRPTVRPVADPDVLAGDVAAARQALESGDLDTAERLFTELRNGPSSIHGHLGLGGVRFERARYEEAERDFDMVLQQDPNNPEGLLGKAMVLWEQIYFVSDHNIQGVRAQISGLIGQLRALPDLEPKMQAAVNVLEGAFITAREGVTPDEDRQAEQLLQQAGQQGFTNPVQLFYLGESQLGQDDRRTLSRDSHEKVAQTLASRIRAAPARVRDWLYLIKAYARLEREEALIDLESLFNEPSKTTEAAAAFLFGKFSWAYCIRARDDQDFERGILAAERGLAIVAGHHNCFIGQSFALDKLKRYDAGMQACDRYLASNTSYEAQFRGMTKKARFLLSKGDKDRAIPLFDQALELDKTKSEAWKARGLFREALRDYSGAVQDYTEALRILPTTTSDRDRGWYYSERGSCHYFTSNVVAATTDLDMALKLNPNDPVVYLFKAYMLQDEHQHDRALNFFTKAIELNPRLIAAYRFRAKSYRELGLHAKADADEAKVKELEG